jgi:hypothetical protein
MRRAVGKAEEPAIAEMPLDPQCAGLRPMIAPGLARHGARRGLELSRHMASCRIPGFARWRTIIAATACALKPAAPAARTLDVSHAPGHMSGTGLDATRAMRARRQ